MEFTVHKGGQNEVDLVTDRFTTGQSHWNPMFDYRRKLTRDWRMEMQLKKDAQGKELYPWRSKIFIPMVYEKISTIFPNLFRGIFPKEEFVAIVPGRGELDKQLARKNEQLLYSQLRQRRYLQRMMPVVLESLLMGSKLIRTQWVYESQMELRRNTARAFGVPIEVEARWEEVELYDGPDFFSIPFYRFFLDPYTPPGELQKADWIIEEMIQGYSEFLADAEYFEYKNIDKVKKMMEQSDPNVKAQYDQAGRTTDSYRKSVKLLMYYDREKVLYIAQGSDGADGILVYEKDFNEVNPHGEYPYVAFLLNPAVDEGVDVGSDEPGSDNTYYPGGFYPMGTLHSLHHLQLGINTLFNQRNDLVTMGLNPAFMMREGIIENESDLEFGWMPGQILGIKSDYGMPLSQVMQQVSIQNFMSGDFAHQFDIYMDMAERASGMNEIISGRADPSNSTATATMQLTENANNRFRMMIYTLTASGVIPMLEQYMQLNALYLDPDTTLFITGSEEPITLNPEDVLRRCNFIIKPGIYYNRQIISETLAKFIPLLMQIPTINLTPIIRTLLENLEIFDDISMILPDDNTPMTPMMIQQLQMAMAGGQNGQNGQNGGNAGGMVTGAARMGGSTGNIPKAGFDSELETRRLGRVFGG